MKIAICDDERRCLDQVLSVADEYIKDRPDRHLSLVSFSHPEDLLEAAEKVGGYDIYILDIVMPHMNGIQLGTKLRENGYDGKIIYLTSSEEYAIDSFRVKPYHYLLKPIEKEDLFRLLDEIYEIVAHERKSVFLIKAKESNMTVGYDSLLYAELVKRAILYQLVGGKTIEGTTLRTSFSEAVAELLSDRRFVLCGSGMLINLHHVKAVEADSLVFRNGTRVYLGKKLCRDMRVEWNKFWFEEVGQN